MFDIENELKKLPAKPGVYIMRDKDDNIIYVGKAISLKNRVRQYFRKNNKTTRIEKMVSLVDHFEYIVVENEAEALILECNLIKENRPKFNVLLKDDKTYPYIKIDVKSQYPNVFITRRITNDGSKYFGPYANPGSAKEMVNFIRERFKIRQCKNFKSNKRECLNYHIGKCLGPCVNKVSRAEYMEQIYQIEMLLSGKIDKVITKLKEDMNKAALEQNYEVAAEIRDRIQAIENISQKQKVANTNINDIDVIGIAKNKLKVCVEIFFVRGSKMIGREHYFFDNLKDMDDKEILSGFIKQYYMNNINIPSKIMLREEIEDKTSIEEWLTNIAGRKVELKSPQKGEKLRFIEMAEQNALITLNNKEQDKFDNLNELKEKLNLKALPRKIESYDISHISGTFMVAGMCVMKDGKINKSLSRRFRIKTVFGQDDPMCMEEVVTRRLKHSIENPKGGFGELPDLILADGGITQIRAIKTAISKYNIDIPVYGMVKNYKHQTRALIGEDRIEIEISERLFNAITEFQDTVHETAIEYHRKLREEAATKSQLDDIKGIGDKKKQTLLQEFGTIEAIKKASIEDIMKIKGINSQLAEKILKKLKYEK